MAESLRVASGRIGNDLTRGGERISPRDGDERQDIPDMQWNRRGSSGANFPWAHTHRIWRSFEWLVTPLVFCLVSLWQQPAPSPLRRSRLCPPASGSQSYSLSQRSPRQLGPLPRPPIKRPSSYRREPRFLSQLRTALSTKTAKPGDAVYLSSSFPVVVGGRVVIPAGVYVQGYVDGLQRGRQS